MFKIGSLVVYGMDGVCEITDITSQSFVGGNEIKEYYVLVPVHGGASKLFVPVDNELLVSKIKPLLSYDEIMELINQSSLEDWIIDNKLRNKYYKEVFASYDRQRIFSVAKLLYYAKEGKLENVKKLYAMDEDVLRKTTQILFSEFSYTVDLTQEDVLPFIAGEIVCNQK